jgi:flagellar protein FliS
MSPTETAYRKTALGGASGFGLMIALYDTLAGNLRRAAEAERRNDLEMRCRQVNHALLVIGQLEDWTGRGPGGELAKQLIALYTSLRRSIVEAQARRSPEILEQQMARVLEIREIWQKLDLTGFSADSQVPVWVRAQLYPGASLAQYEPGSSGWSA